MDFERWIGGVGSVCGATCGGSNASHVMLHRPAHQPSAPRLRFKSRRALPNRKKSNRNFFLDFQLLPAPIRRSPIRSSISITTDSQEPSVKRTESCSKTRVTWIDSAAAPYSTAMPLSYCSGMGASGTSPADCTSCADASASPLPPWLAAAPRLFQRRLK